MVSASNTGQAAGPFAAEAHPDPAVGGDPDIIRIIADLRRSRRLRYAGFETDHPAVAAGRDIDERTSNPNTLGTGKFVDRSDSFSGVEVDHFQRTVRDARDKQPPGRGIVGHVSDRTG
jgi:hypothetical protein